MKRYKINVIVFICVLTCFTASVTLFSGDTRTIQRENRALNVFPKLTSDTVKSKAFAEGLEDYMSDRAGYRASLIDAAFTDF